MSKKLKLDDLSVKSFVTRSHVVGGNGTQYSECQCYTDLVCGTDGGAGCGGGGTTSHVGINCALSYAGTCTCPPRN